VKVGSGDRQGAVGNSPIDKRQKEKEGWSDSAIERGGGFGTWTLGETPDMRFEI
jgi:hypothetical protein